MKKWFAALFGALLMIAIPSTAASASDSCDEVCEWVGETAWVKGADYDGPNWAMYHVLADDHDTDTEIPLVVGRKHTPVGNIRIFPDAESGTATIWIFFDVAGAYFEEGNAIHIQWYGSTPTVRNPAPGQFDIHVDPASSRYAMITGVPYDPDGDNFYGIHADVLVLAD